MRTGFTCRRPRLTTAADIGRLLLLLLLMVRAWVPMGYMPDADALRQGRLALGFCAAGGGSLAMLQAMAQGRHSGHNTGRMPDAEQAHAAGTHAAGTHAAGMHAGVHPSGHDHHEPDGAGQECPFGLSAHQVLQVPPAVALAPVLLHWLARVTPPATHPRPPMPAAGPPLGQRAPPSRVE